MTPAEILYRIRHQVFAPCGSTMGACPDCGHGSRGSQRCAVCIVDKELAPMVGAYLANEYHAACKRQRAVELRILAMEGYSEVRPVYRGEAPQK